MNKDSMIAALVTFIFLGLGFMLLHDDLFGYGISFFVFLPFILGYLLGGTKTKKMSLLGFGFSFVTFCILLLGGGLEGMVCILLAMPLIWVSFAIGMFFKMIFSDISNRSKKSIAQIAIIFALLFIGKSCLSSLRLHFSSLISTKNNYIFTYTFFCPLT